MANAKKCDRCGGLYEDHVNNRLTNDKNRIFINIQTPQLSMMDQQGRIYVQVVRNF